MNQVEHLLGKELEASLRFEALIARLSARFINLPGDQLDGAIEDAQKLVCESLGLDRSALFQRCESGSEKLLLTHFYQNPIAGGPPVERRVETNLCSSSVWVLQDNGITQSYAQVEANTFFPWIARQLRNRQTVVVPNVEAMPPEAAVDQEKLRQYGAKSTVVVPLFMEDTWLGCLTFASMRERKPWPGPSIKRFEFVADVFTNALARKKSEHALRETQMRLTLATESAGAGLWGMEADGQRVWVTPRTRALFRFGRDEELSYERFSRIIHPDDRPRVLEAVEHALATDEELLVDYRIVWPEGTVRWVSARGRRHCSTDGKPPLLMGASVDITERKAAEEKLQESEHRFRALVDQAGDGFELLDEAGKYLDVNAATLKQLGYTREEMLQLSVFDVAPLLTPERFREDALALRNASPLRLESIHRRKDGSTFPVEVTVSSIQLNGGWCMLTLVRDITERKLAEEALGKSYAEIKELKERLEAETAYLKAEIKVSHAHGEIIGHSRGIKQVLYQVEQVAAAECAVLLTGETGTGKELIAQEIHRLSRRRDRLMVLVNCAALPSALVESELFGRERGAYTGALTTQVGRFEMADGSTIFLDEVGELSTEVQAKLLRVLQQGEFQRLGSPKTHKVDVRVIAATNRDLAAEVRKGRFREDLYYRLRVFPIAIPPLKERSEDIPLLVFSFMEEFATRMGKKVTKVSRKAMERLQHYPWPGNIRELRNVIEHSVIVSPGDVLTLSLSGDAPVREAELVTLAEAERDHILRTLESTRWRIKGPHGAAYKLALQPSTLYSRMQKLGIPNRRQKDEMATES